MTMQADAPPAEPVAEEAQTTPPVVETSVATQPIAETPSSPLAATPASPPAPVVVPTIPSPTLPGNLPPEVQEYVTRLEQQAQSAREQNERQILDQTVAQYAARLQQQYDLSPEYAAEIARTQGNIVYQQYQAEQMQHGKVRAAIAIAKEFGVDPMQLMDLASPQAMRQTAQTLSGITKQTQELAALREQVAKLTKAAVPAQTFALGAQPGAGAGLTGDALEAAWLKHETTQPTRPNPYDSAYRAMLRG